MHAFWTKTFLPSLTTEDYRGRLRACFQAQYDLSPVTLTFLPLGHDYNAGMYRVESEQGTAYALKVTSRALRTTVSSSSLSQRSGDCIGRGSHSHPQQCIVDKSRGVDRDRIPLDLRRYQLDGDDGRAVEAVGTIFRQIPGHAATCRLCVTAAKETFDPTEYARWVRTFEAQHAHAEGRSASERALRSSWVAHQSTIHTVVTSLEKLAAVLQSRPFPSVICHADLHARNLIRDRAGQVFVIDWDEVMLAPKERDFIFVRHPHADAFFHGYGQAEIDWVALTYYLWERVVQDLIECTHNVCFREDWGEESRAEAVQLLDVILAEERGHIDAAYQASAHLPRDLTVH